MNVNRTLSEHLGDQMEEKERHVWEISQLREVAVIENATNLCNGGDGEKQIVEKEGESSIVIAAEAVPLKVQPPTEVLQSNNSTEWIQQNIMRLSREFGVDFKVCEETAELLFLKIDNNKQVNKEKVGMRKQTVIKKKAINELKRLEINSNFVCSGSRKKGGCLAIKINEAKHSFMEGAGTKLCKEKKHNWEHFVHLGG